MQLKLMFVLLVSSLLTAHASGVAQQVTLNGESIPLSKVFSEIRIQTGYRVVFNYDPALNGRKVKVVANQLQLADLLKQVLENQPFEFELGQRSVFVSYKLSKAVASVDKVFGIVTGTVTDSTGTPISGVSVRLLPGGRGTVTNANGVYALEKVTQGNYTLRFSYVGFNTVERKVVVQEDKDLQLGTIVLSALDEKLEQVEVVVNTGYQTLPKERSTGAFGKPDMEVVRNRSTGMNILQRLDGLVPGLVVNNAPNASANPLSVRGLTSLNGNRNPLYVVDGVPLEDISSINPQDVADITVLKDAAASSIWGSRASNGVVVIQTRKGDQSGKLSVEYDAFYSFQGKGDLDYLPVLNSRQFIQAARDIFNPTANLWGTISNYTGNFSAARGVPPHELILYNRFRGIISAEQEQASLDSLANISNADQISDLWYRPASLMNHSLSVRGGSKNYSFYGSAAYTQTVSNRPGDKNDAFKINFRQDIKLNKAASVFLITDLTNQLRSGNRNINVNQRFYPYQLFRDEGGQNISMPYMQYLSDSIRNVYSGKSNIDLNYNPLDETGYGYTKSDALLARMTAGLSIALAPGLKFEGTYGLWKGDASQKMYDDAKAYSTRVEVVQYTVAPTTVNGLPVYHLPAKGGKYTVSDSSTRNWTVRNQLTYNRSWKGTLHQLSVLGGQEAQEQLLMATQTQVRGYNELLKTFQQVNYARLADTGITGPVMPNMSGRSLLTNSPMFRDVERKTRFTSYYANAAYTFDRKYTVSGSWRIDESNLFGKDKSAQNRPVWSAGGKWQLSEEEFMAKEKWIGALALRATYGITGNSPNPGSAASYDILTPNTSITGPDGAGLVIATPANTRLTWERTETINLGIDFSFFDHRLEGALDVYRKNTENLIGRVNTNVFSGYAQITGNLGDMLNKGVEFQFRSINVATRDFSWNTLLTFSFNKNKITRLNLATPIATGANMVEANFVPGYSAYAIFAYRYAGLNNTGSPQVELNDKTITTTKNVATPEDILYMGTAQPVWSGGLSNTFRYGSFSLNLNIVYNLGHVMRRDVNGYYSGRGLVHTAGNFSTGNIHAEFANRWKATGDEVTTDIPAWVPTAALAAQREVAYYTMANSNVLNAGFIKLRDVTLAYNVPAALLQPLKLKQASLRLQMNNIMLWKENKEGIDPEFHNAIGGTSEGGSRSIPFNQNGYTVGLHIAL